MTDRQEQKWSQRDVNVVGVLFLLLLSGALFPVMIAVAFGLGVAFALYLGVRQFLRVRRWRREPPGEFWTKRLED